MVERGELTDGELVDLGLLYERFANRKRRSAAVDAARAAQEGQK